jgi:outer membrane lipoprotein SlyB
MNSVTKWLAGASLLAGVVGFASAQPLPGTPAAAPAPSACTTCGVVDSVKYVEEKGQGTGAGAVIGGVAGGVLGHQIGSGRGNTVATIAGVGVGAVAGNQVEKNVKKKSYWVVTVSLDNGKQQSVTSSSKPAFKQGDRVKILDGSRLALLAN